MEPEEHKNQRRWIALPVEGRRLQSCRIESSAKDGELTLDADGHLPIHFGVSRHISFGSLNGVKQRFDAMDDNWVALVIEPADQPVRIVEAKIDYWLDETLEELLARSAEGIWEMWEKRKKGERWTLNACFNVRLAFELESTQSMASGENRHVARRRLGPAGERSHRSSFIPRCVRIDGFL